MCKKGYHLILMAIMVLATVLLFSGCSDKLDEPVFVKSLVCSSDMDAEIEFITDDDFKLKAVGVEIPDMPEGLHLDFYDESVDHYRGYDLHSLNIGVGADALNESGGLKEDFVFHEVIVEWDDGSRTKADIGTIHMTAGMEYDFTFDWKGREDTFPDQDTVEVVQEHYAAEDLLITKIEIPYIDELPGMKDMVLDGRNVSEITEEDPLVVEKGKTYAMKYTIDTSVSADYGKVFLEYRIIGIDKQGEEKIVGSYFIQGNDNRVMPEWMYEQIENAEQK